MLGTLLEEKEVWPAQRASGGQGPARPHLGRARCAPTSRQSAADANPRGYPGATVVRILDPLPGSHAGQ